MLPRKLKAGDELHIIAPPRTHYFFDVDSTIISRESLMDMVLLAAGASAELEQELAEITNAGMNGEITFEESLKRRFAIAPITKTHMETVTQKMLGEVTHGMHEFIEALKKDGHDVWMLTAGIRDMMLPLAKKLGIPEHQVLANEAEWNGDTLSHFKPGPMLRTEGKAEIIRKLRKDGRIDGTVIMVGDGSSDLAVFTEGVADDFYGFGEHAVRPTVMKGAPRFFRSVREMRAFVEG